MQDDNANVNKVSVIMITYGHEKYIRQAVEGVLMQKCSFNVELIVADDCSPDNTSTIVESLINSNPNSNRINYTKHLKNKGMQSNFIWAFKKAASKYIALCEGDDYWTDPLKLQKQVDFLEENEEYGICFHNVEQINSLNGIKKNIFPNVKLDTDFSIYDYILSNRTATCSIVFKKALFNFVPNWFKHVPFGDLGIILTVLKNSNEKARVLKDVMGVYRIHENGIHGSLHKNNTELIKAYKQHIQFFNIIKKKLLTEVRFKKTLLLKFENTYKTIAQLYKKEGDGSKYLFLISKSKIYKLLGKI